MGREEKWWALPLSSLLFVALTVDCVSGFSSPLIAVRVRIIPEEPGHTRRLLRYGRPARYTERPGHRDRDIRWYT